MFCKNCGFKNDQNEPYCSKCGEKLEESVTPTTDTVTEARQTTSKVSAKKAYIGGMISSVIAIVFGIIMFCGLFTTHVYMGGGVSDLSSGTTVKTDYGYYGGDAYTGIQQASADASNNAKAVADNVATTNSILADTSSILADSADGYNAMQNAVCRCVGLLTIALGAMGFFYFFLGYIKG